MKRASHVITDAHRTEVERAITDVEHGTSAEIVVVVASKSGRYDRAEDLFGLLLALVAVAVAWWAWQAWAPDTRDWSSGNDLVLGLLPVLAIFTLWAFVGAGLATWIPELAKPFIPRGQMEFEVRRAGFEAFHLFRVGRTKNRHGVLIYVSILERLALVVGDDAVNETIPQETWNAACRAVTEGFRRDGGDAAAGLVRAVHLVGTELAAKFPKDPADTDELPNTVHVID